MAESPSPEQETLEVELRNAPVAALLAWLWPGAGHIYQGRTGKGLLFMICILSTWFFGLALAYGHSVYASNTTIARQLVFGCQLGAGLPAAPALLQAAYLRNHPTPLWGGFMAPPNEVGKDELSDWSFKYGAQLDMGVLYTMIAGLLNVLAVFDAYGGPLVPAPEEQKSAKKKSDSGGAPPDSPPEEGK
jgi:uncharacterized protein DUF6677